VLCKHAGWLLMHCYGLEEELGLAERVLHKDCVSPSGDHCSLSKLRRHANWLNAEQEQQSVGASGAAVTSLQSKYMLASMPREKPAMLHQQCIVLSSGSMTSKFTAQGMVSLLCLITFQNQIPSVLTGP